MLPPCLSAVLEEGLLGKLLSVGVMAGLPIPDELELLERCCWEGMGRTGLIAGGRSWAPGSLAHSAGLNVLIIMVSAVLEEEPLPRLRAASGSRMAMVCEGLAGSELTGFFSGSSVSSTTSGACLAVFWRSSSRSSCRAVLMVFSMSWMIHKKKTFIHIQIACGVKIFNLFILLFTLLRITFVMKSPFHVNATWPKRYLTKMASNWPKYQLKLTIYLHQIYNPTQELNLFLPVYCSHIHYTIWPKVDFPYYPVIIYLFIYLHGWSPCLYIASDIPSQVWHANKEGLFVLLRINVVMNIQHVLKVWIHERLFI